MSLSPMEPSQGFLTYSEHYYKIAKNAYYRAKQGDRIQRQNDALVAIIFAVLSLEAFINELATLAQDAKAAGDNEYFLDDLIDVIDESHIQNSKNKTTRAKFLNTSAAFSKQFNKGEHPYQDFADLFRLRDCLVHLKPEDRVEIDESGNHIYSERKLITRLRSKNIFLDTSVKSLPLLVSTAKAAKWACDVAAAMVTAILDRIPDSEFSRDNEALDNYRSWFQPLEKDEQEMLEEQYNNRQLVVTKVDELRTKLLEQYGEFPDSLELICEDRSR